MDKMIGLLAAGDFRDQRPESRHRLRLEHGPPGVAVVVELVSLVPICVVHELLVQPVLLEHGLPHRLVANNRGHLRQIERGERLLGRQIHPAAVHADAVSRRIVHAVRPAVRAVVAIGVADVVLDPEVVVEQALQHRLRVRAFVVPVAGDRLREAAGIPRH